MPLFGRSSKSSRASREGSGKGAYGSSDSRCSSNDASRRMNAEGAPSDVDSLLAEAERLELAAANARAKASTLAAASGVPSASHTAGAPAAPLSEGEVALARSLGVDEELLATVRRLEGVDGRAPVKYVLTCSEEDYAEMLSGGLSPEGFKVIDTQPEAKDDRLALISRKYSTAPKFNYTMETTLSVFREAVLSGRIPKAPERSGSELVKLNGANTPRRSPALCREGSTGVRSATPAQPGASASAPSVSGGAAPAPAAPLSEGEVALARSLGVDEELLATVRRLEGVDGRAPVKYVLTCSEEDYAEMLSGGLSPEGFKVIDTQPEAKDDRLALISRKYSTAPKFNYTMETTLSVFREAVLSGRIPKAPERSGSESCKLNVPSSPTAGSPLPVDIS